MKYSRVDRPAVIQSGGLRSALPLFFSLITGAAIFTVVFLVVLPMYPTDSPTPPPPDFSAPEYPTLVFRTNFAAVNINYTVQVTSEQGPTTMASIDRIAIGGGVFLELDRTNQTRALLDADSSCMSTLSSISPQPIVRWS